MPYLGHRLYHQAVADPEIYRSLGTKQLKKISDEYKRHMDFVDASRRLYGRGAGERGVGAVVEGVDAMGKGGRHASCVRENDEPGKKRSLSCEGVRGLKGAGWPPEEEKRKKASDKRGGGLGC
jgi:hypothetical protein